MILPFNLPNLIFLHNIYIKITYINCFFLLMILIVFQYADLSESNLCGANLSGCCLERSNLSKATLDSAQLLNVKLLCANLEGASLKCCNFEDPAGNRANCEGKNLFLSFGIFNLFRYK